MYDKYGNYGVMWWTNRSVEQYKSRSDCMVKQYSKFSYFNKHVSKIELYYNPRDRVHAEGIKTWNLNVPVNIFLASEKVLSSPCNLEFLASYVPLKLKWID